MLPDRVDHFHHSEPKLKVDVKVSLTTRGPTWEIEIKDAESPQAALEAYDEAFRLLQEKMKAIIEEAE